MDLHVAMFVNVQFHLPLRLQLWQDFDQLIRFLSIRSANSADEYVFTGSDGMAINESINDSQAESRFEHVDKGVGGG